MNALILLARTDSKRLPQKAILQVEDKKLIEWCISLCKKVKNTTTILCTSDREIDMPLIQIAEKENILSFQGDAFNIAKRVTDCIEFHGVKNFARVNGDSPFLRIELLEKAFYIVSTVDFVTNLLPRSFPYGVSVEVFRSDFFLEQSINFDATEKEHITSYFYQNKEKFNYYNINYEFGDFQELRLTVDTKEDLNVFKKMLQLNSQIVRASIEDIIKTYNLVINNN